MKPSVNKPFELTGRHALFGFGAFFAVLIAVQAAFITVAIYTHTGLVSKQPYRKGINYGGRIAQAHRQEKLGWHATLAVSKPGQTLTLRIVDQYGAPVLGLRVAAMIGRGVTDAEDHTISFAAGGDGAYTAKMPGGLAGTYIADISASNELSGDDIVWRMRKRLWLQP